MPTPSASSSRRLAVPGTLAKCQKKQTTYIALRLLLGLERGARQGPSAPSCLAQQGAGTPSSLPNPYQEVRWYSPLALITFIQREPSCLFAGGFQKPRHPPMPGQKNARNADASTGFQPEHTTASQARAELRRMGQDSKQLRP